MPATTPTTTTRRVTTTATPTAVAVARDARGCPGARVAATPSPLEMRMSQVIISSEGNSAGEEIPWKSQATPQLDFDWPAISPASILSHCACAQGK